MLWVATWMFVSSICLVVGSAFYRLYLPERSCKVRFLAFGGFSHNWHHLFAALSCYAGFAATSYIADYECGRGFLGGK